MNGPGVDVFNCLYCEFNFCVKWSLSASAVICSNALLIPSLLNCLRNQSCVQFNIVLFVHNIIIADDRHVLDVSTNTIADRPGIRSFCEVVEMPQEASLVLLSEVHVQRAAVHVFV